MTCADYKRGSRFWKILDAAAWLLENGSEQDIKLLEAVLYQTKKRIKGEQAEAS